MLELFASSPTFKKFLAYVGLIPLILRYIEIAEATGKAGDEKRLGVQAAVMTTADHLIQAGFLPASIREGLLRTAGELTDVVVTAYNAIGFFRHKTSPGKVSHERSKDSLLIGPV